MQDPDQWNTGESGEQTAPQQPSYRQRGASSRGGRQVNPGPSEPPIQQQFNVEQAPPHPRLLNVGPKPTKWAGTTPLSAFKTDFILHYRATELPKQKWGIASIAFLSDSCRTTFLSRLAAKRGLQADPELVAQEDITWEEFSRIMTEVFGQQVTEHEIRAEIETHTRLNSSGPDTISFIQVLDQLYGLCKHPVDEFTWIQQLQRALQPDLSRATQLQLDGKPWESYDALRQHLILLAPTYDSRATDGSTDFSRRPVRNRLRGRQQDQRQPSVLGRRPATLRFKKSGRPDIGASQQGTRGRATGGCDARIGTEASWAMNPETLGKDSYNPTLPPRAWGYIYKSGRCYWCFQKWRPGHVCDRDAPREIPSLQVRSTSAAVSHMPDNRCMDTTVGDEKESVLPYSVNKAPKQQKVSQNITVHSSLAAISAVCDAVTATDLQTRSARKQTSQKQTSALRLPPIWVPTPKAGVPAYTPTDRTGTVSVDTDDRMLHPKIFKQIQKLSNHTFTLDACANSKGDNALCSRYCSVEDSFLNKDLKGEFVWLNPPFKHANEFLEAYFAQKRTYPDQVGACILLPCWRQFANIPELRQMTILK